MEQGPWPGEEVKLYKAVYEEYEQAPLPSRSSKGRFHEQSTGSSTTYLATSPETAWKEVTERWSTKRSTYRMVEVVVRVSKVVDLTDSATRERYGVDEGMLTAEDHGPCQQLAARVREEGVEAVWTFSRADRPEGRQLVVFLDLLGSSSSARVHRVSRME